MDIGTAIGLARGLSDGKSVGDSSSVTVAKAQGASQDGKVTVILDGDTEPIEIPTVSAVGKGDDVLVAIRDGSPSAMGAFGSGDAIAQHFWHDETGAHIEDSTGGRLDLTANRIDIGKNSPNATISFVDGAMEMKNIRSGNTGYATISTGHYAKFESRNDFGNDARFGELSIVNHSDYSEVSISACSDTSNVVPVEALSQLRLVARKENGALKSYAELSYSDSFDINGFEYVPPNGITAKPSASKSLSTSFSAVALAQVVNVNSDLLSISGNRITCNKAGYVVVDVNGFCSGIASKQYAQVGLFVSGVQSSDYPLIDAFNGGASAYYASFSGTGLVHVTAGDYLEFRAKTSSGTATLDVQSRFTVRYASLD